KEDDILKTEDEKFQKLANAGIDVTKNKITYNMIVDVEVENFDHFFEELKAKGTDIEASISKGDLERLFDLNIYTLIANQQEEKRKYAPARSWKAFRNAINAWFCAYISMNRVVYKAILINDLSMQDSVFRNIIGKALEIYKPIRIKEVEEKEKKEEKPIHLKVPKRENWYTEDYELFKDFEINKSALLPFYLKPKYTGRENEVPFIKFLEEKENILWWYKNGDSGSEYFAIKYYDTFRQTERLFYVDFIVKLKNGKILMVDTKSGITATSQETKNKAEALQKWIKNQKDLDIIGGIVLNTGGTWKINNKETYNIDKNNSEFVDLGNLI
ncbi:MAG: restriction endonuclease subunit R, partial [Candidatus Gracilibacteria bacterium]|nr:restriction endonuclease subunit R [Candidatus Gracilibacteria bacterium]